MSLSNSLPNVSIVIASKDRRSELEKALNSIHNLDYPRDKIEIVVVEETDKPKSIPGVNYIPIPRKNLGYGYARNQCVKHAHFPLLAFTDDDCEVHPQWLKELVSSLDKGCGGSSGAVYVKSKGLIGFCESVLGFPGGGLRQIWRSKGEVVPASQLSTCNCLFRKKVFETVGLFKENTLFSGEDYDLAQRVLRKYKCKYNPKAIIYHKPRGSFLEVFKWFVRRGRCEINMVLLKTHSLAWQVFYILYTSLFLRLLVLITLCNLFTIPISLGLTFYFVIYFCLNLYRNTFQLKYGGTWKTVLLTPIVKLVMDVGWDVGKLSGLFLLLRGKLNK